MNRGLERQFELVMEIGVDGNRFCGLTEIGVDGVLVMVLLG